MSRASRSNTWSYRSVARRAGNPLLWLSIGLAVLLLVGLVVWLNALTAPQVRAGVPTATVPPLPAVTVPTPTPVSTPTAEVPTPSAPPSSSKPKLTSSGKFRTSGVAVPAAGSSGELRRYVVRVETSTTLKADQVATQIAGVLNDPRSWTGSGSVRFALVADPKKADVTITLSSPATAKSRCTPDAVGTCVAGTDVVIDAAKWQAAGTPFTRKADWQAYLANHGVGHLLGNKHLGCPKKGQPAPAMMPQAGDLKGCKANPWPHP